MECLQGAEERRHRIALAYLQRAEEEQSAQMSGKRK